MIDIDAVDLEKIVEVSLDDGDYTGRISVRGGLLLPGRIFANPYRIIHYGFVFCEGMTGGVLQYGSQESASFRLYEVRVVSAFVKALRLSREWIPPEEPDLLESEIMIPRIRDARLILAQARIPIIAP